MNALLHTVLTVAEILLLVIGVAIYLIVFASQLRAIADSTSRLAERIRTTEQRLRDLGPAAAEVNSTLGELRTVIPPVAEKASRVAARR